VLNVVFIYGVPLEEMKGVVAIGSLAASRLFGPEGASLFSALMALGLLSTVNAMVTVGPRVYYAMAKNAAFFAAAAKVHPHWRTPVIAIVAQGVCTMLMTLAPFRDLIVYIGFLLNFFAVMSVASLFIFRRRPGWQKLRVVSFAYPLIPVVFVLIGSWMTYQGLRGAFAGDNYAQRWTIIAAVATVGAGALVYHLRIARRAA
jgi:APA family basic amino acid/polyamine antiporter